MPPCSTATASTGRSPSRAIELEARELKTGDRVGDRMEILDGLTKADRVAVTDVDTLTDGMKVAVTGE